MLRSCCEKLLFGFIALLLIGRAAIAADAPAASGNTPAATAEVKAPAAGPAPAGAATPYGRVSTGPFTEDTTVDGKIDVDLRGVWLVNAAITLTQGKYRNFAQILQVTGDKDQPKFHLIDVKLPEDARQSLLDANRSGTQWVPGAAILGALSDSWSKLPLAQDKLIDEFLYDSVKYLVIAPDKFTEIFPQQGEDLQKVLKDSLLAIKIVEGYKPRDLGPDSHVAQMITRTSVYGVRKVEKPVITGVHNTAMIAVGANSPLPYTFIGPFAWYRLGSQ